jgi:tetratricopeptide (TPR) repeat protein
MVEIPKESLYKILSYVIHYHQNQWRNLEVLSVCREWNSVARKIISEIYSRKGTIELKSKRYDKSIYYYDKVLFFDPKNSRALNNKAVALKNLGYHEAAIFCLDKLLHFKPNYIKALNNKGDNLNYLKKYDDAIECFDKALRLDPSRLSVLYNKGKPDMKSHYSQYTKGTLTSIWDSFL